ncbi:hypothetical protein BJV82DRAFT_601752 [Fennellomyces sp. T-0311]|nr:hypothetical protein BJV82DRAFT_601752 [Fennellomyces sp. T-0311]
MDGGGFFNNNNDSSFNSGSSAAPRKPMGEQTMRPVTVKQITNCTHTPEGGFRIDNVDVTQLTFVGVIRNITELSTNISYSIEDGTGIIEVRLWLDQSETAEDAEKRRVLTEDTYVRVFGRLNSFGNKTSVIAFRIRPITEFNEINYHFIEATLAHVTFTSKSSDGMAIDHGSNGAGASESNLGNKLHDKIMEVIRSFQHLDEGASIDQITFHLKGQASDSAIREAVEYLTNEGHCYSTINEDHYKSTEA